MQEWEGSMRDDETENLKAPSARCRGVIAMTSASAIWRSEAFHRHLIFPKEKVAYLRDFHCDL